MKPQPISVATIGGLSRKTSNLFQGEGTAVHRLSNVLANGYVVSSLLLARSMET